MDKAIKSQAELAFKKKQREDDATEAWKEHLARQKALDANTLRLRALRLARDAAPQKKKPVAQSRVQANAEAGPGPLRRRAL
jgi:hypothetical protein